MCSNSLKSDDPKTAAGMLKRELETLGSLVLACARATAGPAGGALAVDRDRFAALVTDACSRDAGRHRRAPARRPRSPRATSCSPPVRSPAPRSSRRSSRFVGDRRLAFFDAAAPVVDAATIDHSLVFAASRYDKGGGADYLNCPMDRAEYEAFVDALLDARRVVAKDFETAELFQACQPIEEIARSGRDAPRFGAMKPVGLTDPRTGRRPWAVVQLRPENAAGTAYNLVGFQTNLTYPEQDRVFRMIPGLADAEFLRHGVMHRNTFIDAPRLLTPDLALREEPRVRVAGQLAGTEGYLEAAADGPRRRLSDSRPRAAGAAAVTLPPQRVLGALLAYATDPATRAVSADARQLRARCRR